MIQKLQLRPLDDASFSPFGQVLDWRDGNHPRRNFAAQLANLRPNANPNLRVQRTQPTPIPLELKQIERHRFSSQLFAPLSGTPYFVIVFPSDAQGEPIIDAGIAFAATGNQAVNYNRGTWHHGFMAKDQPGTFLMLRWEDAGPDDEEFRALNEPILLLD